MHGHHTYWKLGVGIDRNGAVADVVAPDAVDRRRATDRAEELGDLGGLPSEGAGAKDVAVDEVGRGERRVRGLPVVLRARGIEEADDAGRRLARGGGDGGEEEQRGRGEEEGGHRQQVVVWAGGCLCSGVEEWVSPSRVNYRDGFAQVKINTFRLLGTP